MMDFDFNFKPSDYYDGDIQKEILESPNDLDEFVENGVTIAAMLLAMPSSGLEPETSPLPRECSTAELQGQF